MKLIPDYQNIYKIYAKKYTRRQAAAAAAAAAWPGTEAPAVYFLGSVGRSSMFETFAYNIISDSNIFLTGDATLLPCSLCWTSELLLFMNESL